jgi:hypothetical protein
VSGGRAWMVIRIRTGGKNSAEAPSSEVLVFVYIHYRNRRRSA